MPNCYYCKKEIFFSDDPEFVSSSGKHIPLTKINGIFHKHRCDQNPYNKDGSSHDCRKATAATTETITDITGQKGQKEPTIGQLKIWIDRLEKVGIHIDINEILNPKKDKVE